MFVNVNNLVPQSTNNCHKIVYEIFLLRRIIEDNFSDPNKTITQYRIIGILELKFEIWFHPKKNKSNIIILIRSVIIQNNNEYNKITIKIQMRPIYNKCLKGGTLKYYSIYCDVMGMGTEQHHITIYFKPQFKKLNWNQAYYIC